MKRITLRSVLFACGLLATSTTVFAQSQPAPAPAPDKAASNWFSGGATLMLLGRDDVASSKFQEYREVPKGVSMPFFNFQGSHSGSDFALFGENISKSNQRYSGYANTSWVGITFDYNQIPHNMGNDARTFFTQTGDGVWSMSPTLRAAFATAAESTPTTGRTYAFYSNLLGPTINSAGFVNISDLRQHGYVTADFGQKMPFDLAFTYMRDVKTGARGASGGDVVGAVTSAIDVLEPLNEVTQDFGLRWALNRKGGNVYAQFNHNIYNDRAETLIVDNPFRPSDKVYVGTGVTNGGPGQVRFSNYPDNSANRFELGGLYKAKRQTRISGNVAFGTWSQDAQFLPFTINSVIFTPAGIPANTTAGLSRQTLEGKADTTALNFAFMSRPVDKLAVRVRYRTYDMSTKTPAINWVTVGSTSSTPDRSWENPTADTDAQLGYVTANPYDWSSKRFDAQAAYDVKDLTLEAGYRHANLDRTNRESASGADNGYEFAAVYNAREWVDVRFSYDWLHRTAEGETLYGFQADEAERKTNRTGVQVTFSPKDKYDVTFSYFRRNDDYPNRPNRIAVSGGVPVAGAQPIPNTPSGLLNASYDTFTVEGGFRPNARAELNAYYTWEKNAQTNQWSTTTGVNLNNRLNYAGSDKANTFGVNGVFHVVPDKWTFTLLLQRQKVDGLMDITANETGSFYNPGRTTLVPPGAGGALDINDFDDTEWTTAVLDLAYTLGKDWSWSAGYAYDQYKIADAFTSGTTIFPQSVLFYLKPNNGNYTANIGYTRLTYRF